MRRGSVSFDVVVVIGDGETATAEGVAELSVDRAGVAGARPARGAHDAVAVGGEWLVSRAALVEP